MEGFSSSETAALNTAESEPRSVAEELEASLRGAAVGIVWGSRALKQMMQFRRKGFRFYFFISALPEEGTLISRLSSGGARLMSPELLLFYAEASLDNTVMQR